LGGPDKQPGNCFWRLQGIFAAENFTNAEFNQKNQSNYETENHDFRLVAAMRAMHESGDN
jgi:hypothetical protein